MVEEVFLEELSAAQGLAEIQVLYKRQIMSMKTGDKKLFVSRDDNKKIRACLFVFQFDGPEVPTGYENAKNGEREGIALMKAWEKRQKAKKAAANGTPAAPVGGGEDRAGKREGGV